MQPPTSARLSPPPWAIARTARARGESEDGLAYLPLFHEGHCRRVRVQLIRLSPHIPLRRQAALLGKRLLGLTFQGNWQTVWMRVVIGAMGRVYILV